MNSTDKITNRIRLFQLFGTEVNGISVRTLIGADVQVLKRWAMGCTVTPLVVGADDESPEADAKRALNAAAAGRGVEAATLATTAVGKAVMGMKVSEVKIEGVSFELYQPGAFDGFEHMRHVAHALGLWD